MARAHRHGLERRDIQRRPVGWPAAGDIDRQ
jgi:hypothetical protein